MTNPFTPVTTKHRRDPFLIQGMRATAWIILAITAAIFLHIILKGAPVVFSKGGGDFLTRLPETLHVIQDKEGNIVEARPGEVDAIKEKLGASLRQEKTISYSG